MTTPKQEAQEIIVRLNGKKEQCEFMVEKIITELKIVNLKEAMNIKIRIAHWEDVQTWLGYEFKDKVND